MALLKFKNDSGPATAFSDAIGAVVLETKGVQRIWLRGGGTFTVHGTHEEIVKQIEDAKLLGAPAGEQY